MVTAKYSLCVVGDSSECHTGLAWVLPVAKKVCPSTVMLEVKVLVILFHFLCHSSDELVTESSNYVNAPRCEGSDTGMCVPSLYSLKNSGVVCAVDSGRGNGAPVTVSVS